MTAQPKTRHVHRQRETPRPQAPRGVKQIVIPMTRPQYDEIWQDAERVRAFLAPWLQAAPELFPAGFDQGYRLHGFGRPSRKLPGVKLRKVVRWTPLSRPKNGDPSLLSPQALIVLIPR